MPFVLWVFMSFCAFPVYYTQNITNIMDEYIAVCGHLICNTNHVTGNIYDVQFPKYRALCPTCSCSSNCIQSGSCCPDIFFSIASCVNPNILESHIAHVHNSPNVLMITTCPTNSDDIDIDHCEVNNQWEDLVKNVPVSSVKSGITYRNIHCSACNDERNEDIVPWRINIDCAHLVDFNFLSSYAEIYNVAVQYNCSIAYLLAQNSGIEPRLCNNGDINECNISGTWQHYDQDIEFACHFYDNKYHFFKNVFCYMCNPPLYNSGISISECNATGLWSPFDANLETLCLETKQSRVTGYFKNVYCYLCNTLNDKNFTDTDEFADAIAIVEEDIIGFHQFEFRYKIEHFNLQYIIEMIETENIYTVNKQNVEISPNDTSTLLTTIIPEVDIHHDIASYNVTKSTPDMLNIYKSYLASTKKSPLCQNYSAVSYLSPCICDELCSTNPVDFSLCCIDMLFTRSKMCTNEVYSIEQKRYIVYNDCLNKQYTSLSRHCHSNSTDYLFFYLPVDILVDQRIMQFKNMFCALCELNLDDILDLQYNQTKTAFWEFTITCDSYVTGQYHITIGDYIKFAKNNKCIIKFSPPTESVECGKPTFDKCNSTGHLIHSDPDINWACQNLIVPKFSENEFCSLCNPMEGGAILYTKCNETGEWPDFMYQKYIEDNCLHLPQVESHKPFKNSFCKTCNEGLVLISRFNLAIHRHVHNINNTDHRNDIEKIFRPTYRVIFSLLNSEINEKEKNSKDRCTPTQIFDPIKKMCVELKCYPGRILIGTFCAPLLEITYNLGYVLAVELRGFMSEYISNTTYFLQMVKNQFHFFLSSYMTNLTDRIQNESSIFMTNVPCTGNKNLKANSEIVLLINQKLSFTNIVNRSYVEDKLLILPKTKFNFTYTGLKLHISIVNNSTAIALPSLIKQTETRDSCYIQDIATDKWFTYSYVTDLLTCRQVELQRNEFYIDNETHELIITNVSVKFSNLHYVLFSQNKARICADEYMSVLNKKEESSIYQDIVGVMSMACTCISLVCLFITFWTYMVFPSLRSLPGKINVCLVFAMFCSQSVYQFGVYQNENNLICSIIGVIIHYFWLVTFGCLNICSFHMYCVFRRNSIAILHRGNDSELNKTLLFYMLYAYGMPFVLVSLNAGLTATFQKDSMIGYGGHVCFLNQTISIIVTFMVPVILVCLSNIFFFAMTAKTITATLKLAHQQHLESNRSQFTVYVKLFTITGITWIFQIIDSLFPTPLDENVFSAIVSVLSALQGVFIFVSYICNNQILMLCKRKTARRYHSKNNYSPSVKTGTTYY